MKRFEYKTINVKLKGYNIFKARHFEGNIEDTLNNEGREGWKLHSINLLAEELGSVNRALIIFEREV